MSDLHVFLSPHLDDAVLSCGGIIYQRIQAGEAVRVITIFAGDPPPGPITPFAQSLHARWQAAPAERRAEDSAALGRLGAQAVHWLFPEAVYRRSTISGAALYDTEDSIFGEMDAADTGMTESIAAQLRDVEDSARLYVPLGAGHHVDHQLVRAVAESLDRQLIYYEEYPYVETPQKLEAILNMGRWSPELVRLGDAAIRAKAEAILAYRSQMSTFFQDANEMTRRVRAYAVRVGGGHTPAERLWTTA